MNVKNTAYPFEDLKRQILSFVLRMKIEYIWNALNLIKILVNKTK
jgi:hypothetical protein